MIVLRRGARVVVNVAVLEDRESIIRSVDINARAVVALGILGAPRSLEPHPAIVLSTPGGFDIDGSSEAGLDAFSR